MNERDAAAMEPVAVGAADEAAVVALWRLCGLVAPYNDPAADFRFARGRPGSDVLGAFSRDGVVAATAMVGHDGHRGWLYYVAVAPHMRGRGLGRRMVAAAEGWLAARGVRKAQLLVRETNAGVLGFYEKLGYGTAPRVVMQKWIDCRE